MTVYRIPFGKIHIDTWRRVPSWSSDTMTCSFLLESGDDTERQTCLFITLSVLVLLKHI